MNDNVIILGAGASKDAGIPMSKDFVNKMRDYAFKGMNEEVPLSALDKEVFKKARGVMDDLDKFHSRANFDDRNIEDILSILSFDMIGETQTENDSFNWMIKAIARTIELSCNIKYNFALETHQTARGDSYRLFWAAFFEKFMDLNNIPTIITFNYDLVLERSLFQQLNNIPIKQYPFDGIILQYHYNFPEDFCYKIVKARYINPNDYSADDEEGTKLQRCLKTDLKKPIVIEILKLHGSLNFPQITGNEKPKYQPPTELVNEPFIIPPISNKSISDDAEAIWKVALTRLREAKNIVIVGYSLPRTDVYVQYFLKTALGPNLNLNQITVFNPELFRDNNKNSDMRKRYYECFSEQVIRGLINFIPEAKGISEEVGSFRYFVYDIPDTKNELFF